MKLLVLVVEDNEDSRYLLEKILQGYGHKVMAAANGAEALQQALAQPPDIIISDIMMPKMDGYQLCRECKQNEQLKNIPFVFYPSTYTREEDEKFALSLGGAAFVAKPTEPAVLVQMLSEIVEKAESGALAPPKITPLESSLFLTEYTKRIFAKLESTVAQLEIEITERRQAEHNLNERMKELECLYSISKITERAGINLDETYQEVTNLIPQGWQYPDITCARVTIKGNEFITPNFRETDWKQDSDIIVDGQRIGVVKVYYLEEKPECDEGPFLKEERNLINGITNQLESSIQRKQAEKELRESEERYSALMNLGAEVGEAVVMLQDTEREEGLHTFVNDEWSHITGYSMEELLNMSFLNLIHPKDREVSLERHQGKMSGKAMPGLFEMTIIRKDGTEVLIELTSAYTTYKGKRANVAYMRDITERKKMEEQLIVTDRLASIGELSSGIAHELNNPLTSVIGFSELLLDKELPDDTRKDLEIINREAKRTAGVVRNLLTFARKHESENQSVDIHNIIQKVLELRVYEQKVSNIAVNTRFAPDLPEITADGFQLQQVFINIIINAEHFMTKAHRRGTLTITTERVGDIIRASFADDGPGIAKENLGHLFDPFFTTKEVGKGTGLGLSICHGIITEHGGKIYVESELGKGATFVIELPIATTDNEGAVK